MSSNNHERAIQSQPLLEIAGMDLDTPAGRPLFRNLNITLAREQVAVIGRNGVGKSSLLDVIAGRTEPKRGKVRCRVDSLLVPQDLTTLQAPWTERNETRWSDPTWASELAAAGLKDLQDPRGASRGQLRKVSLLNAKLRRPGLLLLDEPTQDLDERGVDWLSGWLGDWSGAVVLVSHDRRLLNPLHHFFLLAESGCRYFPGSLSEMEQSLEQENADRQRQYVRNLNVLAEREQHNATVCRRRQRKKNVGRLRELARLTPRTRLNKKRSYAQVSQGRAAKIRDDRITTVRSWAKAARRPLSVNLPLEPFIPVLPADDGRDSIVLEGVSACVEGRRLFDGMELRVQRHRVAVMGPNGSGKSTLLRIMMGHVAPSAGIARTLVRRMGEIAQGATNWLSEDSLLGHLTRESETPSPEALAHLLLVHRFPLALAERPLVSLSPGERVRAALICLLQRSPPVEVLLLDEPTDGLDFVGTAALRTVLKAWPGGIVVVSHDRELVASIGIRLRVVLDGQGGHRIERAQDPSTSGCGCTEA